MLVAEALVAPYGLEAGFSLRVAPGEFVGLVGPNGAGKSTLLRCLAGALRLSGGTVTVAGVPVSALSVRSRAQQVAYLPQLESAPAGYTVRDVVALGRYAHRRGLGGLTMKDVQAIDAALGKMALDGLAARRVSTLSGGEYQRVRVARALAQGASTLLLDEPVAHLDPGAAARLMDHVATLDGHARPTIVAALHDLNLAALYCDRLVMLRAGSVLADGDAGEVLTKDRVHAVYGRRCVVVPHPESKTPQVLMSPSEGPAK